MFEHIYFARPDSQMDGETVWDGRRAMGAELARESPAEADLVVGLPDSGTPAAIGYAGESGIPYAEAVVRNRYVGRSFIQPEQAMRQQGIRLKFNPLPAVIAGKRLVVVDDSIVRGNTTRQIVAMLLDAGAAEVHMRISSPPILWPCFYGIDMADRSELVAAGRSVERDRRAHRLGLAGLPEPRRPAARARTPLGGLLPGLLHRRVPDRGPRLVPEAALRAGSPRARRGLSLRTTLARRGLTPARVERRRPLPASRSSRRRPGRRRSRKRWSAGRSTRTEPAGHGVQVGRSTQV